MSAGETWERFPGPHASSMHGKAEPQVTASVISWCFHYSVTQPGSQPLCSQCNLGTVCLWKQLTPQERKTGDSKWFCCITPILFTACFTCSLEIRGLILQPAPSVSVVPRARQRQMKKDTRERAGEHPVFKQRIGTKTTHIWTGLQRFLFTFSCHITFFDITTKNDGKSWRSALRSSISAGSFLIPFLLHAYPVILGRTLQTPGFRNKDLGKIRGSNNTP